jgi:hypothetical protein
MGISTKIERIGGKELVRVTSRSEGLSATNKPLVVLPKSQVRPINYELLVGTNLPEQDWHRLGALVGTLLNDITVVEVEIWQTDAGLWVADALVITARGRRLRRGEGETPLQAVIELIYDIQRY